MMWSDDFRIAVQAVVASPATRGNYAIHCQQILGQIVALTARKTNRLL
ncbi:MAG: hypothetical protein IPI57_07250 [Candidatus Competibacteraceae bacterium]|nr:hypothetical protein [Candidatus Competibacteraceae bacterium]